VVSRHKRRDYPFHRAYYRYRDNRWGVASPLEEAERRQVSMMAAYGRKQKSEVIEFH